MVSLLVELNIPYNCRRILSKRSNYLKRLLAVNTKPVNVEYTRQVLILSKNVGLLIQYSSIKM